MKNRITSISVASLMIVALIFTGCGNNQTKTENETIKIGVVLPLSGNAATLGDYTLKGLQLAVEEQNAKGGLLGKTIVLDIQDSKADPKEGVNVVKKMFEGKDKPFMVYSIMSGVTMALRPVTEENKAILMSAVGTDKFLENSKYTIRNYVAAKTTATEISNYLSTNGVKNLTMFYSNNEYGNSVKEALIKRCEEKGIGLMMEPFEESSMDNKSLIASKINKNTEYVYVVGVGKGLGTMLKQIKESGYTGKIVGDQLITFPDVVNLAGSVLNGTPYLDFAFDVNSTDEKTKAFVDAYKTKFQKDPENFSVITYEGAKLLFSVVEKTKSFDSETLITNVNEIKNYPGVFGVVNVNNRNVDFSFKFKTWGK